MVRWVVGSILHGVDPLSHFSFQSVLHDCYNKVRGVCYPVWDCAYKITLAVNREKVSHVAAAGLFLYVLSLLMMMLLL